MNEEKKINSLNYQNGLNNLEYSVLLAPEGVGVEFGVYSGKTLSTIREHFDGLLFGFDSFKGLPEDWRNGFEKGTFETENIPSIEGATIVVGLFTDTIPNTLKTFEQPITFAHFDADLYSSTIFALEQITPYLGAECIFVFDEYQNYTGFEDHEYKAFQEWQGNNPEFCVESVSAFSSYEQATFKITKQKEK
jgi:hypothetical protein